MRPYVVAVLLVALAFALTFVLRFFFPYPVLFLFFAAVMSSAWFGGTGAGLFAVLISTIVADYFFVPPFNSFVVDATNVSYFGSFVVCALVASWISASKKKSEEALREARVHLELKVAERTAALERSNVDLRKSMAEHEKAQTALMKAQAELAHLSRVTTMGELTTSIAHEISQPLTAVVTHGHACLEWLTTDPPKVERAKQTAERIIQDGTRAGAVLGRIRALFKKRAPAFESLNVNDLIEELAILLRDEAIGRGLTLRTELDPRLPEIKGDRVQLQQVVLNLVMNGMEAMTAPSNGRNELLISSRAEGGSEVVVAVQDGGVGIPAATANRIFEPFFTTKPQGIGMGLSISRSIIESHRGRLWAAPLPSGGTVFQFEIPAQCQNSHE